MPTISRGLPIFTLIALAACSSGSKDMTREPIERGTAAEAGQGGGPEANASTTASTNASSNSPAPNTPQPSKRPTVLFVGTSLTAGYGIDPTQAYPAVIERLADSTGIPIVAKNLGVSGETSAGALRRIAWVLKNPADVVVLETGANDALRGLTVESARSNIEAIIDKIQEAKPGIPILLVQMEAPPNLGTSYTRQFHNLYPEVAKEKGVALAPFLLDGVAGEPGLNQADGLHPNPTGAKIVAQNVWKALAPIVQQR